MPGESSGGGASAESTLTVVGGTNYTITVGAGGAGAASPASTNGGSGVVITKEPEVDFVSGASGVWGLNEVYDFVKAGTWTN